MTQPPLYSAELNGVEGREITVAAGSSGVARWRFTCGGRPIKPGGGLEVWCEFPKFWLATISQMDTPDAPGYVSARGDDGLEVELVAVSKTWKSLCWARVILPSGMAPGQSVTVEFGSERFPATVVAHKYKYAPVSWRVDYEGEGEFCPVWPPTVLRVVPGPAAKLYLVLPGVAGPGEPFCAQGRVEDASSNIGARLEVPVKLELVDAEGSVVAGSQREARASDAGTFRVSDFTADAPGVYRVRGRADGLPDAWSNAVDVRRDAPHLFAWGDCHCHSVWADGVGSFQDNIEYARDQAFLDVFGFAEHLCNRPAFATSSVDKGWVDWAALGPHMAEYLNRAYRPGSFVTILGHEYTPSAQCVNPTGDFCLFSPSARWEDTPMACEYTDLADLARESGCVVIPHVGGRYARWPGLPVDPLATPLVEIASMHGHFEGFAQEALQLGHKLGFVGMSDGHFGMPGYDNWAQHGRTPDLAHRNYSVQSSITAFLVKELTRDAVFEAMRKRLTYATTGQRILLHFNIQGRPMGSEMTSTDRPRLRVRVNGTAPLALVEIIRGDRRALRFPAAGGERDVALDWTDPAPLSGETWYYIRVTQADFSLAWSSPIWVDYQGPDAVSAEEASLPHWSAGPPWPPDRPETCDEKNLDRLRSIFAKRGIAKRFADIRQVGVFQEPRGRFALFRAKDTERDGTPVHIHLFVDFADDRIYMADGESDFGLGVR